MRRPINVRLYPRRRPKKSLGWIKGLTPRKRSVIPAAIIGFSIGAVIACGWIYLPKLNLPISVPKASPAEVYFNKCYIGGGTNCVVDGDTFWANGVRIRISDIDAPETHPPHCKYEADLGFRATDRLQALLNDGPIDLEAGPRDEDVYGRKLRVVTRNGESLGMRLVSEGLARPWTGSRRPWC